VLVPPEQLQQLVPRMLEKPAAYATSVNGIAVVSISVRAVCARCARAIASGPAPSSSVTSRVRCRSE
jgi:hypothetical protein